MTVTPVRQYELNCLRMTSVYYQVCITCIVSIINHSIETELYQHMSELHYSICYNQRKYLCYSCDCSNNRSVLQQVAQCLVYLRYCNNDWQRHLWTNAARWKVSNFRRACRLFGRCEAVRGAAVRWKTSLWYARLRRNTVMGFWQ